MPPMMLLLSRSLLAALVLAAVGCDSPTSDPARSQFDADLQLELGQTGQASGLTITFEAITEDSRCPEGADCVWAGEATVRLMVDGTAEEVLAIDPELAPGAVIRRGAVELRAIDLAPYPGSKGHQRGDTSVVRIVTQVSSE